ncbi:MAG: response regulator transcription factor [Rhodocyclaceae bacterium]|nr:response regulator transcription factor [Rhodocyclaceae bacterium]
MDGVVIVEDDEAMRDALVWLFASRNVETCAYASAEHFLAACGADGAGCTAACLVLDVRLSGMSGPELFRQLRTGGFDVPVIFLTGHGDIPLAVAALKDGAFDFLEKPFDDNYLVDRALIALEQHRRRLGERAGAAAIETRLASLSAREREVMDLILAGRLNKQIADDLGVSIRTVEVHRSRVFEKMGARAAVDLARLMKDYNERN